MRILVTGASGFLGEQVVARLSVGHIVRATARRPLQTSRDAAAIEAVQMDLADGDLRLLVADCDAIIHCAARTAPWGPRELFMRDNVMATRRLLDAAVAAGTVRRFVQISSPSIYFRWRDALDLSEDFDLPACWPTPYAESKWISEQAVLAESRLGPVALRPRAVIGAGDRAIVPRIVALAQRGYFPLPGGGRALIDVTCVDNVVDAIELALQAPSAAEGRAFNITNGEPMSVRNLLTRLFAALDLPVRLISAPRSLANGVATSLELLARLRRGTEPSVTRYGMGLLAYSQTLSIDAARSTLGYRPRVSVDEGIRRYAAWRQQFPDQADA
ncbi:MAG: NAD-dependent epimerase/dehydratase family protein [Pseudomonadota bacterium]